MNYAYYQYAKGLITEKDLEDIKKSLKKNNFAKEFSDQILRMRILLQYNLAIRNRSENFNSESCIYLRPG